MKIRKQKITSKDGSTTQLRLALEAEDERSAKKWNGFDLDLIWIEIGVFKNVKECARSPCNGKHFSSNISLHILLCVLENHSNDFTKVYKTSIGCTGK